MPSSSQGGTYKLTQRNLDCALKKKKEEKRKRRQPCRGWYKQERFQTSGVLGRKLWNFKLLHSISEPSPRALLRGTLLPTHCTARFRQHQQAHTQICAETALGACAAISARFTEPRLQHKPEERSALPKAQLSPLRRRLEKPA